MTVQLALAHLRQFMRDPAIVFWAVLFPVVLAGILGVAFGPKTPTLRTVPVVDQSQGQHNTALEAMQGYTFSRTDEDNALRLIRQNKASIYLKLGESEDIEIVRDPANSEAVVLAERLRADWYSQQSKTSIRSTDIVAQGSRFIDFLIPGLLAFGIMNSCMWGVAWNLVEYRMKKLLRRLTATPMRRFDFVLSFVLARLVVTFAESLLLAVFAYFIFDVQVQGSILALFAMFFAGVYSFGGLAVLAGSRGDNTQVGNGIVNAITLPSTMLSGVFFSYQNFPEWAVPVLKWLPLSVVADSTRAIYNEGAGFIDTVPALAYLMIAGSVCYALGIKIFRWS